MHALQVFDEAVRAPTRDFWQVLIVIFMLELVLNMTAYWGWEFWGDGWHLFDAFIIFLCVMELILPEDMPGVKQMRVLKTLRILRVFKRLEKLRLLINSLLSSLGPLSHAFLIMLILFAIFSTVGVEMFHLVCTNTRTRTPALVHAQVHTCVCMDIVVDICLCLSSLAPWALPGRPRCGLSAKCEGWCKV